MLACIHIGVIDLLRIRRQPDFTKLTLAHDILKFKGRNNDKLMKFHKQKSQDNFHKDL